MAYVRSAGLRGVREVIEELGGDADALARRSGIPAAALDDDEILVQDLVLGGLLENASRELDCPDFGLRVALRQDLSMLGPLALAIKNALTTTQALEMTSKYMFFHARSLEISIVADPEGEPGVLGVRYGYRNNEIELPPQSVDMALLFLHRSMAQLLGDRYRLFSFRVTHGLNAPAERYRELFGAPVVAGASESVLRLPADLLDTPIEGGDRSIQELAVRYMEMRRPDFGDSVSERTRTALRQLLDTGASGLTETARLLSMSPRTLQRLLAKEETSFAKIRDGVRRDIATRLVTTTDIPMYQIASAIDLEDVTTFSHYARRWWGVNAREMRGASR